MASWRLRLLPLETVSCSNGFGVLKHGVSRAKAPLGAGRTADWSTLDTPLQLRWWSFAAFRGGGQSATTPTNLICSTMDVLLQLWRRPSAAHVAAGCSSSSGTLKLSAAATAAPAKLFCSSASGLLQLMWRPVAALAEIFCSFPRRPPELRRNCFVALSVCLCRCGGYSLQLLWQLVAASRLSFCVFHGSSGEIGGGRGAALATPD
jgi:hypothetical protein